MFEVVGFWSASSVGSDVVLEGEKSWILLKQLQQPSLDVNEAQGLLKTYCGKT